MVTWTSGRVMDLAEYSIKMEALIGGYRVCFAATDTHDTVASWNWLNLTGLSSRNDSRIWIPRHNTFRVQSCSWNTWWIHSTASAQCFGLISLDVLEPCECAFKFMSRRTRSSNSLNLSSWIWAMSCELRCSIIHTHIHSVGIFSQLLICFRPEKLSSSSPPFSVGDIFGCLAASNFASSAIGWLLPNPVSRRRMPIGQLEEGQVASQRGLDFDPWREREMAPNILCRGHVIERLTKQPRRTRLIRLEIHERERESDHGQASNCLGITPIYSLKTIGSSPPAEESNVAVEWLWPRSPSQECS